MCIKKALYLFKRKWIIRKMRYHWRDEQELRRSAKIKGWLGILEVFHFERTYKEIRQKVHQLNRH